MSVGTSSPNNLKKFCAGCGSELDENDQFCKMCGKKYVPLSELAQQPEEVSLIPMRGVQSGGMYGGKYCDIFFTNKRIVALSVFIGTFKNSQASGWGISGGMQARENLQGKIGADEKHARENYENIGWDQAL